MANSQSHRDKINNHQKSKFGCQHSSVNWSFERVHKFLEEQKSSDDAISFLTNYLRDTHDYQKIPPWKSGYGYFEHKYNSLKHLQITDARRSKISNIIHNNFI